MADPYSATGKQVLCEGRHFCDAVTEEAAAKTATVLNAYVEASPLSFGEAERVGQRLHDHWEKMAGAAPLARDDTGWGDVVQQTMRFARDEIARRDMVAL
jgi:hypothetical protein